MFSAGRVKLQSVNRSALIRQALEGTLETAAWPEVRGDVESSLTINRIVDGDPEELAFRFESLGAEMPSDTHANRNREASERRRFLHESAAVGQMELAAFRIPPTRHIYRAQPARLVGDIVDLGGFMMGREAGVKMRFLRTCP